MSTKKKATLTFDELEWARFYAYAYVKGYRGRSGIATYAKVAMEKDMARNPPTAAQQKKVAEIIGTLKENGFAVLQKAQEGNNGGGTGSK